MLVLVVLLIALAAASGCTDDAESGTVPTSGGAGPGGTGGGGGLARFADAGVPEPSSMAGADGDGMPRPERCISRVPGNRVTPANRMGRT